MCNVTQPHVIKLLLQVSYGWGSHFCFDILDKAKFNLFSSFVIGNYTHHAFSFVRFTIGSFFGHVLHLRLFCQFFLVCFCFVGIYALSLR